jgi:N-glycosylase/DNA lyase
LVGDISLEVEQDGDRLRVPVRHEALARRYFALDHPLEAIYASFPTDPFSRAALASCRGLRILRQPLWECLGTFITSPMKQVAHIRQMSLNLRTRYGSPVPGSPIQAYPSPEILAAASENDLRACGLGFRAKSLRLAAAEVAAGRIDLESLRGRPTTEIRDALCRLPGVGRKVANCVLLFAYERLDAVPVDVWISRILQAMRRRKGTLEELERFSARRFGAYAGYVQQYLFHHARMTRSLPA